MIAAVPKLRWWLWGLVAFAVVIGLSAGITAPESVTLGITDHQTAGTAVRVDEIQGQWAAGGVRTLAIISMLGDLVFIGIYGFGSWIAGRSFMRLGGLLRAVGAIIAAAALVFLATDYCETLLQLVQMIRDEGSDSLAGIAATVQPVKIIAWIVTFVGVLLGLGWHRLVRRPSESTESKSA